MLPYKNPFLERIVFFYARLVSEKYMIDMFSLLEKYQTM